MVGVVRKVGVSVLISVFFLGQIVAQDRAILYPADGVALNGKSASIASTVFSGDHIKTDRVPAQLDQAGTQVQIQPNTSLQYGQTIVMGCGAILVDGPSQVAAGETNVTSGQGARYEMSNRGGKVVVQVEAGSVQVRGGGEAATTLQQGQSDVRRGTDGCPVPAGVIPTKAGTTGAAKRLLLGGAVAGAVVCGLKCRPGEDESPSKVSH